MNKATRLGFLSTILLLLVSATVAAPLESWNDGPSKKAILEFVQKTTTEGSKDFVEPAERIAVFDNDGTLWSEQPVYFQLLFAIDQVKAMAPDHPEWKEKEPFKSILAGDMESVAASGKKGLMEILAVTHGGMTVDEFNRAAKEWLDSAKHPKTGRLYKEMTFQPMKEVLVYLRDNGYKTFIVSGGGIEFLRQFSEEAYGIPPEQVVGSSFKLQYVSEEGAEPQLRRLPELNFIDDKEGKPVGIEMHIGRRPIIAFGNSDGDFQMLEWTTSGQGPRMGVLIHHTDAEREWAYDRESHIGSLSRGLDEGPERGWVIVDMAKEWKTIYE